MQIGTTVRSPRDTLEAAVLIAGTPQPLYRAADGALYVAGIAGEAYTLQARNLSYGRAEIISTVDGRNTLKDEPGDPRQNKGLVFGPTSLGAFTGWRISDTQTREFIFGDPGRSMAVQATGSAANVGVIGFAVYREQRPAWQPQDIIGASPSGVLRSVNTAGVAAAGPSLGTGIGNAQHDPVGRTTFTRESGEPEILVIRYETPEVLESMGITATEPQAFPGAGTGYERYPSARQ